MSHDMLLRICIEGSSACITFVVFRVVWAWPTLGWGRTRGVVERAWLAEEDSDDPAVHSTHTVLRVTYTYTVRGKLCRCSRVSLSGPLFATRRRLAAEVARYAPGTPVTVYYDRWHPDGRAVLRRTRLGWLTRSCAVAAIGFVLTGIVVSNEAIRESLSQCLSDVRQCPQALAPLGDALGSLF